MYARDERDVTFQMINKIDQMLDADWWRRCPTPVSLAGRDARSITGSKMMRWSKFE